MTKDFPFYVQSYSNLLEQALLEKNKHFVYKDVGDTRAIYTQFVSNPTVSLQLVCILDAQSLKSLLIGLWSEIEASLSK